MGKTYLNKNTKFQCQNGNAVWFKAKNADLKTSIQGEKVLLEDCELSLIGGTHPGQCNLMPDPLTGAPSPCVAISILGYNWSNTSKLTVSGKRALNSGCSVQCPRMGTIKPFKPTYKAITVDDDIADISVNSERVTNDSTQTASFQTDGEITKSADSTDRNSTTEKPIETKTVKENATENENQKEVPGDIEYVLCDYRNCDKAKECEYLKASCDPKETIESKNAAMLKENIGRDAFDYYAEECSIIATASFGKEMYSIAHHHIIPVNQCFKQYPEIVKLANYYGYDINNALNGICLPTMNEGYDKQPRERQLKIAFFVMEKLGRQWHKGQHSYAKFISDVEKLPKEVVDRFTGSKPFKDYKLSVNEYLEQYRIKLENESRCRAKDYEKQTEMFCETMNHISAKIANKLRKFESDPKKSHSFFVSKIAFYYAYYDILVDCQDKLFGEEG